MDFDGSTQAKSWLFSETSLAQCREIAVSISGNADKPPRVRKCASGFHSSRTMEHAFERGQGLSSSQQVAMDTRESGVHSFTCLTSNEQEILVQFHAHQISMLIGPKAVNRGLLRSSTVLATAIMYFRRFYLSNSVVEFKPRRMAAASAFLAAKVEEKRIDIHLLQHATSVVYDRVRSAPAICLEELEPLSLEEIEAAERDLLEGLNYELRCFHPNGAIRVLAADTASFLSQIIDKSSDPQAIEEDRDPCESFHGERTSPRPLISDDPEEYVYQLQQKALVIAHDALLFSDAPFLYPPGKIAFAAVVIAMRDDNDRDNENLDADFPYLSEVIRTYLRVRFPLKGEAELQNFELQVANIIRLLDKNTEVNLNSFVISCEKPHIQKVVALQAKELRRVMEKVSFLRELREIPEGTSARSAPRKRKSFHEEIICSNDVDSFSLKVARVTPI